MKKITSEYSNKWLKSLEEYKEYWINKEEASSTYVAAINEEPVIPEYDYAEVAATIAEIDEKIAVIKHALNVTNATAKVQDYGYKILYVQKCISILSVCQLLS